MRMTKEDRKQGLLQKLQREAMNRRQIKEVMFCVQQTADDYIAELKAEGRIYIAFYNRTVGMPSPYYMAGNGFDAERPKAFTRAEITALHEKRKAQGESDIRPRTRFVDNQHLVSGCFASMVRNANMSPAIEFPD